MGLIRSGSASYDRDDHRHSPSPVRTYFAPLVEVVARHGVRGLVALVVAAVLAFAPAGLLVWFNHFRFSPVVEIAPHRMVVVRPERHEHEQIDDEAGDTSQLSIVCDAPTIEGPVPLLMDDDPARKTGFIDDSRYVRTEQVYLRRAGDPNFPFGLLGRPPVSVWLPPGEYDVLVVYESPTGIGGSTPGPPGFPLISAAATCTTENRRKTECRVLLPHYERSFAERLRTTGADGLPIDGHPAASNLRPLVEGIERMIAVPTPVGYLLDMPEPAVHHDGEHRGCTFDYAAHGGAAREWTRDQLATLLRWLPADDEARAAREKLAGLVEAIEWRDYFRGWYLYAAAGVAGLVFTRWGATAVLEPWRRTESFFESLKTMIAIFLFAAGIWFLFAVLTDSGGCSGRVPFRIR